MHFIFGTVISVNCHVQRGRWINIIINHKMTKYISKGILQTKFVAFLRKRCGKIKDNIILMF